MVEDFWGGLQRAKLKKKAEESRKKIGKFIEKEVKKGKYISVFPELRKKVIKKKKRKKRRVKKIVYFK